jgi:general stress protein 13
LVCLSIGSTNAFSTPTTSVAFVGRTAAAVVGPTHGAGCMCPSCASVHAASCACGACRQGSALFADVAEGIASEDVPAEAAAEDVPAEVAAEVVPAEVAAEVVPAEVDALDGIESSEEAHNVERPARKEGLKKKRAPKGKDLSEFKVGSMVSGSVKSIQSYGAFVDIGASTDGLLHISQLSAGYVANVGDILEEGQGVEVRIVSIDAAKGQVGLSLMTEEEAATSSEPRGKPRQQRRDDSSILNALLEKGWEPSAFVEGTVVSTVDFGAFVRVSASTLNSECEGEFDGLVHISALAPPPSELCYRYCQYRSKGSSSCQEYRRKQGFSYNDFCRR